MPTDTDLPQPDRLPYRRGVRSPTDEMDLPEGVTCADCVHCRRCCLMFGHIPEDEVCDFSPSRFQRKPPAMLSGPRPAMNLETMLEKCEALQSIEHRLQALSAALRLATEQERAPWVMQPHYQGAGLLARVEVPDELAKQAIAGYRASLLAQGHALAAELGVDWSAPS